LVRFLQPEVTTKEYEKSEPEQVSEMEIEEIVAPQIDFSIICSESDNSESEFNM